MYKKSALSVAMSILFGFFPTVHIYSPSILPKPTIQTHKPL